MSDWSPDPLVAALLLAVSAAYIRAVLTLRKRGYRVRRVQQLYWWIGIACEGIALLSPLDALMDDLLTAHMAEHLLLADIGVPFLLLGVRSPVLFFLLPKAAVRAIGHRRGMRRFFAWLSKPLIAIPIYVIVLYGWHLVPAFETALREPGIHVLQHESFILAGVLVWWSALEPHRTQMRGELWKIGHLFSVRILGMFLGMAFVVMGSVAYAGYYGNRALKYGLTPLGDQQLAGALMISVDIVIVFASLTYFFWQASKQNPEDQQLTEPVGTT